MGLGKKIRTAAFIVLGAGIGTLGIISSLDNLKKYITYLEDREMVKQVLDTSNDREVCDHEMEPFFKRIGLPSKSYSFNHMPKEDLYTFLKHYSSQ